VILSKRKAKIEAWLFNNTWLASIYQGKAYCVERRNLWYKMGELSQRWVWHQGDFIIDTSWNLIYTMSFPSMIHMDFTLISKEGHWLIQGCYLQDFNKRFEEGHVVTSKVMDLQIEVCKARISLINQNTIVWVTPQMEFSLWCKAWLNCGNDKWRRNLDGYNEEPS
jgi:hypothetical protein